jgi:translocation and assembly module TamA
VLATLSIANRRDRKNASDAYLRHLHARAESEIQRALQPFGYYRPFIHSELITDGKWTARYQVEPGAPLRLDSVRVVVTGEGAIDPGYQKLVATFPLHKGDVLTHVPYELAKAGFEAYAADAGYLDAHFVHSDLNVDLASYTSSLDLEVDTGPRHFFGDVRFDQTVVSPTVARKFVTFRQGEPFSFKKLLEMQTALSNTGFYERVEVQPDTGEVEHRVVPILVSLTPSRKMRLTSGLGYGTDDGARATSVIELRRMNRQGHHSEIDLQAGQLVNNAGIAYFVPWPNPRTDMATFQTGIQDVRTTVSHNRELQAGASLSRMLADWQTVLALQYRDDQFTVGTDRGSSRFLIPEITWTRVRTKDPFYVRGGDRLRVDLRGAAQVLLSNASLLQPHAQWKVIYSFNDAMRGIARVEGGATMVDAFRRLPPALRFFAGGTNSVRGYAYNSLGPTDSLGNVVGGRHLLAASLEADYLFPARFGPALFFDMGNAFDTFGASTFKKGVGVGLRWVSPMGMIRGDIGWGLDRPSGAIELHFAVGPEL